MNSKQLRFHGAHPNACTLNLKAVELGVPGCNCPSPLPPIFGRKTIKTFSLGKPSIIVCTPNISDFPPVLIIHLFKQKVEKSLFLIFIHDIHDSCGCICCYPIVLFSLHKYASKFCTLYFMVFEFLIPYQEKILSNARKTIKYKLVLDIYWELLR